MPTKQEYFIEIDADITDKVSAASITPENVGESIKKSFDYTDQEVGALSDQTGSDIQAVYNNAVSYIGQQINALVVINSTTTPLSLSTLNSNYPVGEAYPLGVRVHCRAISGGGLVYERVTNTAWISQPITSVS